MIRHGGIYDAIREAAEEGDLGDIDQEFAVCEARDQIEHEIKKGLEEDDDKKKGFHELGRYPGNH